MVKIFNLTLITVLLLLSCAQRDDEMGSRSNPYDAGGDAWSINAPPEVEGTIDSGWVTFDYNDSTGTYRLHIAASDRNIPYDTLDYIVTIDSETEQIFNSTTRDSVIRIPDLATATTYRCDIVATDQFSASDTHSVSFTTKTLPPPPHPQPYLVPGTSFITISWPVVSGADEYHLYSSSEESGPFSLLSTIDHMISGTITVTDTPDGYDPVYYLVASVNGSGESFAQDTLLGSLFYTGISTPSLNSVSQGTYSTYIRLSIYYSYESTVKAFEIYRSIGDEINFKPLATVAYNYQSSSYTYYNDTVSTTLNCYYRVTAIDNSNRRSRMSSTGYGYITRLRAPSLSLSSSNYTSINMSWSSVSNAQYYRIYRSTAGCSDTIALFDTTYQTHYYDTVPTSDYYYYAVSAVDEDDREGTRSSCYSRQVQILPAPTGFSVTSGSLLHTITMSWSAVTGATGYIVYRSSDLGNFYEPIDSVTTAFFTDTVEEAITYRYRIAAYNNKGIGQMSSYGSGSTLQPPSLTTSASNFTLPPVKLSWTAKTGALQYYIYRSTDTTDFTCIDSTTSSYYWDTLPDFKRYYYRLSMRVADGVTGLGTTASWMRDLPQPTGLTIMDTDTGCYISWDKFPDADYYILYRSLSSSSTTLYKELTDTFYFDTITTTDRYYYKIRFSLGGELSPLCSAISGGIIQIPYTPVSLSAEGTNDDITLTWEMPTNSSSAAGFSIRRYSENNAAVVVIDSTNNTVYHDTVTDNQIYYYSVAAYNGKGTSEYSTYRYSQRIPPAALTGLSASSGLYASKILLTWDRDSAATGYCYYRSTSSSGTYVPLGITVDTMASDTTCTPGTLYYYKVAVLIDSLYGKMTSYQSGVRLAPPATITVTSLQTGVRCTWSASVGSVAYYCIYRSSSPTGTFTRIDSVEGGVNNYLDTAAVEGNNYYRVSAKNLEETTPGPVSTAGHMLFPAAPSTITATAGTRTGAIFITWSSVSGAAGYRLYRSTFYGADSGLTLRTATSAITFTDTVATDSMYFYRVKAYNNGGESALSTGFAGGFRQPSAAPLAPTNVVTEPVDNDIKISWDAPSPVVGYTGFKVYRSPNQNGSDSTVFETADPWYTDLPPLSYPTEYWYRVTAVNQEGESDFSETVSGSRQ
ncbi:MAG: fibronectin type III domain-containing protein [Chitinispirillaceae bacterium]|nr:fibronectin type III domain-containing protein [Chitinispirillaceae bacterium]